MPSQSIVLSAGVKVSAALLATIGLSACSVADADGDTSAESGCEDCPQMATIPAGTFMMGFDGGEPDRYDGPPHEVTIARPFELSLYEVTHGEFSKFVEDTEYEPAKACAVYVKDGWGHRDWANWQNPGIERPPQDNEPVTCVSWNDATAYISWLNEKTGETYRLPTEAEFEYAARAGTSSTFAWGEDPNGGCEQANQFDTTGVEAFPDIFWEGAECNDGLPMVAPVGSLDPNPFGLYDIVGNVWEWTQDCYVLPYPDDIPTDGSAMEVDGECEKRTVRGGSWETRPSRMAVAWRGRDYPHQAFRTFGFRLARTIEATDANTQ